MSKPQGISTYGDGERLRRPKRARNDAVDEDGHRARDGSPAKDTRTGRSGHTLSVAWLPPKQDLTEHSEWWATKAKTRRDCFGRRTLRSFDSAQDDASSGGRRHSQ